MGRLGAAYFYASGVVLYLSRRTCSDYPCINYFNLITETYPYSFTSFCETDQVYSAVFNIAFDGSESYYVVGEMSSPTWGSGPYVLKLDSTINPQWMYMNYVFV